MEAPEATPSGTVAAEPAQQDALDRQRTTSWSRYSSAVVGFRSRDRQVTREELVEDGVARHDADARVVQSNMEQTFMQHFGSSLRFMSIVFLFVLLAQSVLMLWVAFSYLVQTCAGPVRVWAGVLFLITIFNGTINSKQGCQPLVRRLICCFTQETEELGPVPLRVHIFDILTRFLWPLMWNIMGVYWTTEDKNTEMPCQATAPSFFAAARTYAIFTIACSVVGLLSMVGMATVLRYAMSRGLLKSSKAANPKVIESCQVIAFSDMDSQEHPSCSVCLEEYCDSKPIVATPCGHCFHKQCLKNWLKMDRTCPLCRGDLEAMVVPQPHQ